MNILINAYACSPNMGSEPGMAWNWCVNLAKHCELFIITEEEFRDKIEAVVPTLSQGKNMHFYFNPVTPEVRRMCWNQGNWRFYWHYKQWQKRTLAIAQQICEETTIDVVHQLNMVGFREPGYLWKLGKPMVWGPIGGLLQLSRAYLVDAPIRARFLLSVKNAISMLQLKYSYRINQAIKHSQVLISAVPVVQSKIKRIKKRDSILINETGCYDLNTEIKDKRPRKEFKIMWVGRFIYTKRLDIALKTIAQLKDLSDLQFHICGTGNIDVVNKYKELAEKLGINNICIWHGNVENKRIHEMMRDSDLFFFTSIAEATSTVVPEAINNCLPIVCFNACGFGPLVTKEIGRTIELTTPKQSVMAFAEQIRSLYYDKDLLYNMSNNCKEALKQLLWDEKAKKVVEIYEKIISEHSN